MAVWQASDSAVKEEPVLARRRRALRHRLPMRRLPMPQFPAPRPRSPAKKAEGVVPKVFLNIAVKADWLA